MVAPDHLPRHGAVAEAHPLHLAQAGERAVDDRLDLPGEPGVRETRTYAVMEEVKNSSKLPIAIS